MTSEQLLKVVVAGTLVQTVFDIDGIPLPMMLSGPIGFNQGVFPLGVPDALLAGSGQVSRPIIQLIDMGGCGSETDSHEYCVTKDQYTWTTERVCEKCWISIGEVHTGGCPLWAQLIHTADSLGRCQ